MAKSRKRPSSDKDKQAADPQSGPGHRRRRRGRRHRGRRHRDGRRGAPRRAPSAASREQQQRSAARRARSPATRTSARATPAKTSAPSTPRPTPSTSRSRAASSTSKTCSRWTSIGLHEIAKQEGIQDYIGLKKQDLIFQILKERVKQNGLMFGEGDARNPARRLRLPPQPRLQLPALPRRHLHLARARSAASACATAHVVAGQIRPPKENERYFALLRVEAINCEDPERITEKVVFDDLTPLHPNKPAHAGEPIPTRSNMRVVDLVTPIGKGQRGLIVAPPRTGKTVLLQKMANSDLARTTPSATSSCC